MQKLWKKLAVTMAAVCLAVGGLCIVGCDGGTSGTSYQYEGGSGSNKYTDTYNLYDDGTYERNYEGPAFSRTTTLETGTYKTTASSVTFTAKTGLEEKWPSGPYKYWSLYNPYNGTLNTNLIISGTTYKKHGSVYTSK